MNKKRTLPAFSIIEAVVGMAITAIIMGIIFVIFSIVTEQMMDYKAQNQLVNDMNRLTYSINKDIFENEKLNQSDSAMVFTGYSGEKVTYTIREKYALRTKETFIDTFNVAIHSIVIDSVKSKSRKMVFQKIKMNLEVNEKEMDLKFYKRIFANELLQKIKQ